MRPEGQIRRYETGMLPFAVDVYLDTLEGPGWIKRQLRGASGWLQVARAAMSTPISEWTATLVVAITDDGHMLNKFVARSLFDMRSADVRETGDSSPDELDGFMDMAFWDFLGRCDLRHLDLLDTAEAETAQMIEAEQLRGETVLFEVEGYLVQLRRRRRAPDTAEVQRAVLDARITALEQKYAEASAWLVHRLATMRDQTMALEADVMEALQNHGEIEILQTTRWVARHAYDRIYRPAEGNFLMRGRNTPVHNRLATTLLAKRKLQDEETETEQQERRSRERDARLKKWNDRSVVLTRKQELKRDQEKQQLLERALDRALQEKSPKKIVVKLSRSKIEPVLSRPREGYDEDPRVEQNRQRLRTAAQQRSAKHRADILRREEQVSALIEQYPTVQLLDRRLDQLPSLGIENRRLARLIREAIRRVSLLSATGVTRAPDGQEQEGEI